MLEILRTPRATIRRARSSEMGGIITRHSILMYDYGNTAYTHRHRFLATFLYELPYGKGRRFGSNSNKFVDGVLGGWQVAGVIIAQSGSYMTILAPGDPSGTGFNILNRATDGRIRCRSFALCGAIVEPVDQSGGVCGSGE